MAMNEVIVLRDKDILRAAMKERSTTQTEIAKKMGILQTALSGCINREHISMDKFKQILDAMDYDVYIVDRNNKEAMWCVDVDE